MRPERRLPRLSASHSLLGVVMLLTGACLDDGRQPPAAIDVNGGNGRPLCQDQDDDGFGVGCAHGSDCDDGDPSVTSECLCAEPNPGCACDAAGAVASCGRAYAKVGDQLICGEGITTCANGVWGECIINSAVAPKAPKLGELALGEASACESNPCDPHCTTFIDEPGDIGVDESSGIVESEAGITLVGQQQVVGPPVGGGFGCDGGAYPAMTGACGHHICEVGSALDATCDQKTYPAQTLSLLSESFSTGSASGWTLDPSWAVGNATSSSGHTTGNADPSSDTTPTSDDNIAGTVIGGNIGGGQTVFSETFPNLNDWTVSGAWSTPSSMTDAASYPSSGSGNRVARASNCSGCSITVASPINLSSYPSATLELLRFVDDALDSGDYLKVEAYNGSSWVTLSNWAGNVHDDDTWRSETFDLASYRSSGFKVRFVAKSGSSEYVQVDDVKITVPPVSETRWLTSPAFDASMVSTLSLQFRRWLNVEAPATRAAKVEVYDGTAWVNVWTNTAAISESSWSTQTLNLLAYKNSAMRIRFGWTGAATSKVSGWNLDDISVSGQYTPPPTSGCVGKVCEKDATCCGTAWHSGCLALIEDECQISCSVETSTNECVACYEDPSETTDYDGDGFSPASGDCLECDATISPAAYDFKGNAFDDDCDGTSDNPPTQCDGSLAAAGDAWAHAKAIGLCSVAGSNASGVLDASFVRANGTTACSDTKQYYVVKDFGSGNQPTEGTRMVVYSSGTARDTGDPGWIQPNGAGYDAGTSSTPAHSIPPAAGCTAGTPGKDSCGLKLKIRAPSNANSFSFNFNFFTSEYPEWLCTAYNDAFVAYYDGSLNTRSDKNISFDSKGNPVSVNNGFFSIPSGWPPQASGSHPLLNGSGYDGVCSNNHSGSTYRSNSICGGATGWLQTSAPVQPGEEITLHFSIWDTGDNQWDSAVLIDNFAWSPAEATVSTGRYEPGEEGTKLVASSFIRDYDASDICEPGQVPTWGLWSWSATTASDSKIGFYVASAATRAGLDSANEYPLSFQNPPGPSSLAGQQAVARGGTPDTQKGSTVVHDTLKANGLDAHQNFVRVRSYLVPSTDLTIAPLLKNWNLQLTCADAE